MIQIVPIRVKFLIVHWFKIFFSVASFSSKFILQPTEGSYAKATPSAITYFSGHEIFNGERLPKLHLKLPSHIPSVLEVFIFKPEQAPKSFKRSNEWLAEQSSFIKAVVSSAYILNFNSVSLNFQATDIFIIPYRLA